MMMKMSVIMLMLSAVVGQRLIVSSSDMEDITIDGAPAQLYDEQRFGNSSNFLISEPYSICGPSKNILDGKSFIVEHLLGLDCRIPLRLYIRADDLFTAYFNEKQFCQNTQNYGAFFNCQVPSSTIEQSCGVNNLTINVTNFYPNNIGTSHPSSVCYQVVQTNDDQCEPQPCPKPLTWYFYPLCRCQCGYTSSCGPGFKWNGRPSTYAHTHRKQIKS